MSEASTQAAMRWKAVEGFTFARGISANAARLGVALLTAMDSRTGACFPGEVRLATLLRVHPNVIKRAKVELRAAGLIDWQNKGRARSLRQSSVYSINFGRLAEIAENAKDMANGAIEEVGPYIPNYAFTGEPKRIRPPVKSTPTCAKEGEAISTPTCAKETPEAHSKAHLEGVKSTSTCPSKAHLDVRELSQLNPPSYLSQPLSASAAAALEGASSEASPCEGTSSQDVTRLKSPASETLHADAPMALETKAEAPAPQRRTLAPIFFPKLEAAFLNEPDVLNELRAMGMDAQANASKLFAREGVDAARASILARRVA